MARKPTHEELEKKVKVLEKETIELKRAGAALRQSEERYRTVFDSIEEGYFEVDISGNFTFFNDSLCRMLGYSREELLGMNNRDYMPPVSSKEIYDLFNQIYTTGNPVKKAVYEIMGKDGSRGFHELSASLMKDQAGQPIGFRGITHDIIDLKKAWDALGESEERYRDIFNNSTDFVYTLDLEGNFTDVNRAAERLTGYTRDELLKMNYRDYTSPAANGEIFNAFHKVFETGKPLQDFLLELKVKDGIMKYFETSVGLLRKGGEIVGFQGSSRDITDRVNAERALRRSEAKYRMILESIEDGYYEVDLKGNLTFFNDALYRIYGYSRDELMRMNIRDLTDPKTSQKGYEVFNAVFATGNPSRGFEWKTLRKDGTEGHLSASVSLMRDTEGQPIGFRGIIRDITESRQLQSKLQQARKMEAIATLAGGIAHQFNNALTPIIGNIDLLEMDHRKDDTMMESLKDMKASGRRMAHLTSQLLAYARGGKYNVQSLSLTGFVTDTIPLIEHTLNPDVRVETDLPRDVSAVKADPNQMQMVLSALIANSNEAMEGPGRIRISTKNMELDQAFVKDHPGLKPGPYVRLSIKDDGKGMDEETKEHLFEPFFTTHFIGRGLGMPAAYGIVTNHGGTISVDSELGKGTTISIYLPALEAREAVEEEVVERIVSAPAFDLLTSEGTVLIIEDEEPLVKLFRQMLEMLGYRVLLARTGEEAVEIAKTFDGRIDLALLDIKLPDMSGNQVYPLIMEARPNLKAVVCSGYSIDGPAQEILDAGAQGFIQKPFFISTLAEKLKEVLEGR